MGSPQAMLPIRGIFFIFGIGSKPGGMGAGEVGLGVGCSSSPSGRREWSAKSSQVPQGYQPGPFQYLLFHIYRLWQEKPRDALLPFPQRIRFLFYVASFFRRWSCSSPLDKRIHEKSQNCNSVLQIQKRFSQKRKSSIDFLLLSCYSMCRYSRLCESRKEVNHSCLPT